MNKRKFRRGISLLEVAIALAIASTAMVWTYTLIANALSLQKRSIHLNNAVNLAKIKMAQIDASTKLESDVSKGKIPGFDGYEFETMIKEEELDLFKMVKDKKGDPNIKKPEDLLGKQDSKLNDLLKKRGKQTGESETGGTIKIFRITVKISYPIGLETETYTVESFRSMTFQ